MHILGIETSCDETSCAILSNYRVLSNVTLSSLREHKKYGGVVPEIAQRSHLKNIDKVLTQALKEAKFFCSDIDLIAATYTPGLIGALSVGLSFAKTLAISLRKPLVGINHLHAHLFAPFLNYRRKITFPFLGVVVSGGHTELYYVRDFNNFTVLGKTLDDACGEVFDKVARVLGLGYPGGPVIDRLFNPEYSHDFQLKCGRIGFDLSFSGIKTALIYKTLELQKHGRLSRETKIKLVSSFQAVVVEALVGTIISAAKHYNLTTLVCGGGVLANSHLRTTLSRRVPAKIKVLLSPQEYATDNAAPVAGLGFYLYNNKGLRSTLGLEARAS